MNARPFRHETDHAKWGVEAGGIIYEADFTFKTAKRLAQLENSPTPPKDWAATKVILIKEGFQL